MENATLFELVEIPERLRKATKGNKSCDYKVQYETRFEAMVAAQQYRSAVLFSNMCEYFCKEHSCYHIGHDKFMEKEEVLTAEKNLMPILAFVAPTPEIEKEPLEKRCSDLIDLAIETMLIA